MNAYNTDLKRKISFSSTEASPSTSHLHKKQKDTSNMSSENSSNSNISQADPSYAPTPITPLQPNTQVPMQYIPQFGYVPSMMTPTLTSTPTHCTLGSTPQAPPQLAIPDISDAALSKIVGAIKNMMMQEFKHYVDSRVNPLCEAYNTICEQNRELTKRVDELEQYSRRSCVRIFGVPEDKTNTDQIIFDICGKLDIPIQNSDLEVSHRLGPSRPDRARPIIARINNYNLKHRILKESKTKKLHYMEGSKGVWINQDLTKTRAKVAAEARKLVKSGSAKSSFVWDGKVFIVDNNEKKQQISTMDELIGIASSLPPLPNDNRNGNRNGART